MKKVLLVLFILLVCAAHSLNTDRRLIKNYDEFSIEEWRGFAWEMNTHIRDLRDLYLLEILYENWENEAWINDMKHIYSYDSNGYQIENLILDWVDGDWLDNLRMVMTNNTEGYPIEMLYQLWEPISETWMDMMWVFFTYDANWNMTEMLNQMWFGTEWMNSSRYTMTYNTDNNPTYVLLELWDFPNGTEWENGDQEFYTYDGLFLEEIFEEQWEGGAWENARRITYTLEGNYHPADRLKETWNGGGYWDNTRYSQYTYDGDWNEIQDFEQEWDGGWINFQDKYGTYENGYLIERLTYDWETERSWVNGSRQTISYGTLDTEDNTISLNNELLLSNYPNPFNPTTTIFFNVTQTSSFVSLEIYNLKGQKVKTLPVTLSGDEGSAIWNGIDDSGKSVSSGIYFYKLKSGNFEKTKKMILMK